MLAVGVGVLEVVGVLTARTLLVVGVIGAAVAESTTVG